MLREAELVRDERNRLAPGPALAGQRVPLYAA